jgi:hypothetical protein
MAEAPWLSSDEVRDLTKKVRPRAQLRQLKSLGMGHAVKFRTDGSFVVLRSLVEGGKTLKPYSLNLDNLGRGSQAAQH